MKTAVIVAHPDDETIWAGGLMMTNSKWDWFVLSLCRANDKERADKFYKALNVLGAKGTLENIDDSHDLKPVDSAEIQDAITSSLPQKEYDLLITHHPKGEYTRHLRHEQVSKAVTTLWKNRGIWAKNLWFFAYKDEGGKNLPQAVRNADLVMDLPKSLWLKKQRIVTEIYGFSSESFEAKCAQQVEAFWQLDSTKILSRYYDIGSTANESIGTL